MVIVVFHPGFRCSCWCTGRCLTTSCCRGLAWRRRSRTGPAAAPTTRPSPLGWLKTSSLSKTAPAWPPAKNCKSKVCERFSSRSGWVLVWRPYGQRARKSLQLGTRVGGGRCSNLMHVEYLNLKLWGPATCPNLTGGFCPEARTDGVSWRGTGVQWSHHLNLFLGQWSLCSSGPPFCVLVVMSNTNHSSVHQLYCGVFILRWP